MHKNNIKYFFLTILLILQSWKWPCWSWKSLLEFNISKVMEAWIIVVFKHLYYQYVYFKGMWMGRALCMISFCISLLKIERIIWSTVKMCWRKYLHHWKGLTFYFKKVWILCHLGETKWIFLSLFGCEGLVIVMFHKEVAIFQATWQRQVQYGKKRSQL